MVWGKNPGGTDAFYSRISDPTEVAKNVLYITMTLVADSFVVRSSLSPPSCLKTYTEWNALLPFSRIGCMSYGIVSGGSSLSPPSFCSQRQVSY